MMSSSLTDRLVSLRLGGSTCPVKISRTIQTAATQSRTPVRGVAQATRAGEPRQRPHLNLTGEHFSANTLGLTSHYLPQGMSGQSGFMISENNGSKCLGEAREFEEHRYFSSLGVKVHTEKHEFVLDRRANDVERKMYSLIRQEALRRVGVCCRLTEWMGGSGTYGWMAWVRSCFRAVEHRTVATSTE